MIITFESDEQAHAQGALQEAIDRYNEAGLGEHVLPVKQNKSAGFYDAIQLVIDNKDLIIAVLGVLTPIVRHFCGDAKGRIVINTDSCRIELTIKTQDTSKIRKILKNVFEAGAE